MCARPLSLVQTATCVEISFTCKLVIVIAVVVAVRTSVSYVLMSFTLLDMDVSVTVTVITTVHWIAVTSYVEVNVEKYIL